MRLETGKEMIKKNPIWKVFSILNKVDRVKIVIITLFQIGFNLIDLVGIALFGVLGSLAVTGTSSRENGDRVTQVLVFLNLDNYSLQSQAAILGSVAASLLVMKSLISLYFTRKTMYFLSVRGAMITKDLTSKILYLPLEKIQTRSLQENVYALTGGIGNLTNNVQQFILRGHQSYVRGLKRISMDTLSSCSDDSAIKVWNITNGTLIRTLTGHTGQIFNSLDLLDGDYDKSGQQLVSGALDQKIKSWNWTTGECLNTVNTGSLIR
jgi:hypothetical protein